MNNQMEIEQALQALADVHGGRLTPNIVLAAARNDASPLHKCFDWEDKSAAHRWRIEQARRLIRSVRVEVVTQDRAVRAPAYIRDPDRNGNEQGYISLSKAARDQEIAQQAIFSEFMRARAALRRAQSISDALNSSTTIDQIIFQIDTLEQQVKRND